MYLSSLRADQYTSASAISYDTIVSSKPTLTNRREK